MVDRQDREKARFGGGGVATEGLSARQRRERLKQLAMESIDVSKDPYHVRTHLGTIECKLCGTVHATEGNYLAHTQGRRHQMSLSIRAEREKRRMGFGSAPAAAAAASSSAARPRPVQYLKIGRPGYKVVKVFEGTGADLQRGLAFELQFPDIEAGLQPRYSIMSAYEQRVEPPDARFQYIIFAARPYENVAFKIPNQPLDKSEGAFTTSWNKETKIFTLRLLFKKGQATDQ